MKNKEGKMIESEKKIILVAGMGMTPAVLTETVWALAHQKPAVVPDEIVVITTATGKRNLQRDVMVSGIWKQMCEDLRKAKIAVAGKLILGSTSFQVIPDAQGNEIDDLRTGEDNLRAADTMLKTLRQYTDSSDTVVLASIAGGRKTMSALLLSCMSLVGRPEDKVYHVLTAPEFDGPMEPPFFYPKKGVTYKSRKTEETYKSRNDAIELFEVPFVRMGGLYREKYKKNMPSYRGLVNQIQSEIEPAIEIDVENSVVKIGGQSIRLRAPELATLLILARGISDLGEIYQRLYRLRTQNETGWCNWLAKFVGSEKKTFTKPYADDSKEARGDVSDVMCDLRKKFMKECKCDLEALVPKNNGVITYPKEKITIINDEKIRGILDKAFA